MNSLREAPENAAFVRRIETLAGDTAPQWGKMKVAQMLAHCQAPFRVASGELQLKRALIGRLFGKLAKKKFVVSDAPFGRNSPTDPRFKFPYAHDFVSEQSALLELLKRFGETGAVTRDPHPFFGPMSSEEWDRLLWKHLDHHLRQFGV